VFIIVEVGGIVKTNVIEKLPIVSIVKIGEI
jgi:hypothetical protein